ncbi:MAG: carboxymuconolactone decarboxylase family protein [Oscillospiraceae bacterium]
MDRKERTQQKMQELFHTNAAGDEGTDGTFMQILQGFIFGDVCYTGSLDNRMRELVTVTVLTTISALPQLKAHVQASLNAGCSPVEIREAVYQCAPFIGFPKTLNAISTMNEVFSADNIPLPLPEQKTLATDTERYERGLEMQAPLYGTEIKDRYTWLPGDFAEAVPAF